MSLRLARKRLANIAKYLLPGLTLVLAAYYVGMAVLCWTVLLKPPAEGEWPLPKNPLAMAGMCGFGMAFVLFVISRYAGGLSKLDYASLLRAGNGNMFLTSLASLACCIVMVLVNANFPRPQQITAQVIPWLLVVLGSKPSSILSWTCIARAGPTSCPGRRLKAGCATSCPNRPGWPATSPNRLTTSSALKSARPGFTCSFSAVWRS